MSESESKSDQIDKNQINRDFIGLSDEETKSKISSEDPIRAIPILITLTNGAEILVEDCNSFADLADQICEQIQIPREQFALFYAADPIQFIITSAITFDSVMHIAYLDGSTKLRLYLVSPAESLEMSQ